MATEIIEDAENIALFDMDGTLFDYEGEIIKTLNRIKSPDEPIVESWVKDNSPEYVLRRRKLITSSESWWENLPRFQLGWDVLDIAKNLDYRIMILTQGPREIPEAWSGKKKSIDKHLGKDVEITMTRDKGLVFGKVLVDDFPPYIESWLKWRKRSLVIMPANEGNKDYSHKQVIRYDGTNLEQVQRAMKIAKNRNSLEEVSYR